MRLRSRWIWFNGSIALFTNHLLLLEESVALEESEHFAELNKTIVEIANATSSLLKSPTMLTFKYVLA